MGVPSLFRWLSERYPKIIADAIEASAAASDGAGVDASERNPNGVEYDNLYLDMNGIIHPCSHPDSGPKPTCMEDIMDNMFAYIDRIFNIVRPRKLVFLAIDGVAPRAKMNQQRSRRFRAAKDARQLKENAAQKKELMERKGIKIDEPDGKPFSFDTNTITPGTHFMAKVTESLKYYIVDRMRRKGWHGVKVILSDSNIPGEGEHKIMDFIRSQRAQPTYDPNVKHVIYGLDADLIMLALATHEAHFYVLREEVTQNRNNCSLCGQPGHFARNCQGFAREKLEAGVDAHSFLVKPFQFLVVPVLKEYLKRDLFVETPFGFDAERAVDDWVFLCFLVGNDFLPHLPTLKIFEGAIAMLMKFYKKLLPTFDGYITENGEVDLARFELIMNEIGQVEDTILKNRRQKEQRQQHNRSRYQRGSGEGNNNIAGIMLQGGPSNQSAAERIRNSIRGSGDQGPFSSSSTSSSSPSTSSSAVPLDSSMGVHLSTSTDGAAAVERAAPSFSDVVQLGEQGARDRYYDHKFGVSVSDSAALERIAFSYIEGLVWVLKYYYQGCCSWEWYYPYYHAPFSLDLVKLSHFKFEFNLGKPFSPFEQLMAVLPADSCQALPECYHRLMKSDDSPIIDFYPSDFDIDMDGCSQAWMGVSLLPFIDQKRLLREVRALESQLTPEERERNTRGHDFFFFHSSDKLALSENVTTILNNRKKLIKMEKPTRFEIDPVLSGGIFGQFFVCKTAVPVSSFIQGPYSKFPAIQNQVIYFHYRRPKLPPGLVHHAVQLPGAVPPPPLLDSVDLSFQPDDWSLGGPRGYQNRSGYSNQTSDRRAEYGRQEGFHREMQLNDEVNRDYNKPHHQQHGHHDSGHKRPRDDRDHHYQQRHEGSHHDNKRPRYDNQQSAPHQRYANHQSQSQSSSDPQGYRQPRFAAQPPSLPYGRPQEQQQYGQQQQYGGYSNPYQQQQPYGQQQQQQQQQQQYGGYSNPYQQQQQQQRGGPQQPPYSQQQQGGGSSYQQNPRDPRLRGPPGDQR